MEKKIRVVLYSKPGCGLCEEMKQEMQAAGVAGAYVLEEVNIAEDPDLFRRYRYDIPVLLINGVEAFRHRLTATAFSSYLTELLKTT
jgi:glutaredoxin